MGEYSARVNKGGHSCLFMVTRIGGERMARQIVVLSVVLVCLTPTLASQPGHAVDCSDWVLQAPNLHCSEVVSAPCEQSACKNGILRASSNEGSVLTVRYRTIGICGTVYLQRIALVASVSGQEAEIAYVEDRCLSPGAGVDEVIPATVDPNLRFDRDVEFVFDAVNGKVLIPLKRRCLQCGGSYNEGAFLLSISGFSPLFEVLQTYTPTADTLQFRVPAHPEGLPSANHFDTYWGHVSDLPDFSQAQPMACHYPASAPAPGDYMEVPDSSPTPAPGTANYSVTAVTNGTQRRYGRKRTGAVVGGGNSALLPNCP